MKITNQQWIEIIKLISTFLIGIITALTVQSCTMSLSVSKNNSNSTQKTEQTTTSSVDSTNININPKSYQKMEEKEFRKQVLNLQDEVIKTGFKWENVFRAQVLNEDRTEWVIMIGDKLASKELFADEEQIKRYIQTQKAR